MLILIRWFHRLGLIRHNMKDSVSRLLLQDKQHSPHKTADEGCYGYNPMKCKSSASASKLSQLTGQWIQCLIMFQTTYNFGFSCQTTGIGNPQLVAKCELLDNIRQCVEHNIVKRGPGGKDYRTCLDSGSLAACKIWPL